MRLVVGLGNPGERYRKTRHNLGFMVVDVLASRCALQQSQETSEAWMVEARLAQEVVALVKPLTFMNRSGIAVEGILRSLGISPRETIVVVDDVALELGEIRVRERGSHGGHNGLRSLIDLLGTEDFPRIRLGISKGDVPADLAGYVLSDFPEEDLLVVQEVVGLAADAVECWIREGGQAAMNRFNGPIRV